MTRVSDAPMADKHGGQINFVEIIEEQVGGCGAAIHDHQIRFFERG
jgi:hypothetical protein